MIFSWRSPSRCRRSLLIRASQVSEYSSDCDYQGNTTEVVYGVKKNVLEKTESPKASETGDESPHSKGAGQSAAGSGNVFATRITAHDRLADVERQRVTKCAQLFIG